MRGEERGSLGFSWGRGLSGSADQKVWEAAALRRHYVHT